jgi:hypothetical protein
MSRRNKPLCYATLSADRPKSGSESSELEREVKRGHEHVLPLPNRTARNESLIVTLTGRIVGTGLALATLSWKGLSVSSEGVSIAFLTSPMLAMLGFLATTIVGLAAGIRARMDSDTCRNR